MQVMMCKQSSAMLLVLTTVFFFTVAFTSADEMCGTSPKIEITCIDFVF